MLRQATVNTCRAAVASGERCRIRRPPRSSGSGQAGLRSHRRQQRQVRRSRATSTDRRSARRRAAHHQADIRIDRATAPRATAVGRGTAARHRRGRPARPSPLRPAAISTARGQPTRQIADHGRAASSARIDRPRPAVPASMSLPARTLDSTLTPSSRGNACAQRRRSRAARPPAPGPANAVPASPRLPTTRSMPPLHGSTSTSNARRPTCARAVANTDAPAPPRPPSRRRRHPGARHRAPDSAASDSAATSSPSSAGRLMTCWAPTAIATCQSPAAGFAAAQHDDVAAPRQRRSARSCRPPPRRAVPPRPRSRPVGSAAAQTWTTAHAGGRGDAVDSSRIAGRRPCASTPLVVFISPQCGASADATPVPAAESVDEARTVDRRDPSRQRKRDSAT